MTLQEQIKFFKDYTLKMEDVMISKGDDYANEDRLSNFKLAGEICGISAAKQCLSLIATKVARLGNLLDSKSPNNESIDDSIMDLSNYSMLLAMIIDDLNSKGETVDNNYGPISNLSYINEFGQAKVSVVPTDFFKRFSEKQSKDGCSSKIYGDLPKS